jgi:hypothetical protein
MKLLRELSVGELDALSDEEFIARVSTEICGMAEWS